MLRFKMGRGRRAATNADSGAQAATGEDLEPPQRYAHGRRDATPDHAEDNAGLPQPGAEWREQPPDAIARPWG